MSFIVVIPARYSSSRLPGKVLVDINGKPMIAHVFNNACESGADRVIVATDDKKIADVVKLMGGEVCMTSANHKSGTDRLAEVMDKYNFSSDTVIVNLQVDEPMISAVIIRQIADNLIQCKAEMVTLASLLYEEEVFNQNIVKVILDAENYALYFFRSITFQGHDFYKKFRNTINNVIYHHLGIYSYRASFIRSYSNWQSSPLEQIEKLEQLRVLWYGKKIYVAVVNEFFIGVNTQEDLEHIRNILY